MKLYMSLFFCELTILLNNMNRATIVIIELED